VSKRSLHSRFQQAPFVSEKGTRSPPCPLTTRALRPPPPRAAGGPAPPGRNHQPRAPFTAHGSTQLMPRTSPLGPADKSCLQKRARGRARRRSHRSEGGRGAAEAGSAHGPRPYLVVRARVPDDVPQQHLPHRHPGHPLALHSLADAGPAGTSGPAGGRSPGRPATADRKGQESPGLLSASDRKWSP